MKHRLGALLPAVAVSVGAAALLGALAVGVLVGVTDEGSALVAGRVFRAWVIASGMALPLGFVFGVPLLAVLRALRRPRPTLSPQEVAADPEAERDEPDETG